MANFDTQRVVLAQASKYNVPRVVVIDPVTGEPANLGGSTPPAASDTVAGIVELATAAETTTGTDTTRAVTPVGVKAVGDTKAALSHTHTAADLPTSTTAGPGVVELATTTETTTGTDASRAVTPVGLKAVADTKVGTDGTVTSVVKLTQAAYTALGAGVSATTLYVIVG